MNRDRLEGGWRQISGMMQEQWGRLTEERLAVSAGQRAQRAGLIQKQYGVSKEQAERQLKDILRRERD